MTLTGGQLWAGPSGAELPPTGTGSCPKGSAPASGKRAVELSGCIPHSILCRHGKNFTIIKTDPIFFLLFALCCYMNQRSEGMSD